MKVSLQRQDWEAYPDGSSNDSDDYEKRFPTCALPNGDELICRYSCLSAWESYGVKEQDMPFAYEVVTNDVDESSFELEMLLLEARILTWVARKLGLIDCDMTLQGIGANITNKPNSLVSSLASYDQDKKDPNYATCTLDSASDHTEKCIPIVGFMTVGCDGESQSECEDLISELVREGMDENHFIIDSDEIVRVTWVGSRFESAQAPPPPASANSVVSLEAPEKKPNVALSVIIASAVACTLALLAFWARARKKRQNDAEPSTTSVVAGPEETLHDRNVGDDEVEDISFASSTMES